MKKFTENFLLGEHSIVRFLRKIGLSMVVVLWTFLAFGQEAQKTLEYYADGPTGACYNLSNNYEVQISFRDFILIDTFSLELTYDKAIFTYTGITGVHATLGSVVVAESAGTGTLSKLNFKWGNGPAAPVTIGDNVKTGVFKLKFSVNGYPHSYDVAVPQYVFTSALLWNDTNSKFWNITGGVQSPVVTKQPFNGTLTVTQTVTPSPSVVQVTTGTADCYGTNTTATVTLPVNASGMQYSYNGQTFSTSPTTSVFAPSTNNTVRVQQGSCVSYIKQFDVTAVNALAYTAATPVYVNCPGGLGDITIVGSGGTAPYTYYVVPEADWDANVQANLAAPNANPTVILQNYKHSVGIVQKPGSVSGMKYYVAIQDANGCATNLAGANMMSWWKQVTVIDNKIAWNVVDNKTNVTCYGQADGSIWLTIAGATPWKHQGYNIYVDGQLIGKGFSASSQNATGLPAWVVNTTPANRKILAPKTYWVVVQDSLGCLWQKNISITQPNAIKFAVLHTDTGCEQNIGKLWIDTSTITGGTGGSPYTGWKWRYTTDPTWNTGVVTVPNLQTQATGLAAGVYYVEIEDANGCRQTYFNAAGDDAIKILTTDFNLVIDPIKCFGDRFNASIVFTSGTGGHSFDFRVRRFVGFGWQTVIDWNPSPVFNNLQNIAGVVPTLWRFEVRDNTLGCTVTYDRLVSPPAPLMAMEVPFMTFRPSCPENADGRLVVMAMGGTPFVAPNGTEYYEYKMDNQPWVQASQYNTFAIDQELHTIQVRDKNNCVFTMTFNWTDTENYIQFQDTIWNSCAMDKINLFNSNPDNDDDWYVGLDMGWLQDFEWHGAVGTEHIYGPTYGEYTIWTSDSGYVTRTIQGLQFERNPKLYWSTTNTSAAAIVAENQVVNHTTAFGAGTYYLVAADEWGCMSNVDRVVVVDPPALAIVPDVKPARCAGAFDGQIIVTALNGTEAIPGNLGRRYQYVMTQQNIFNKPVGEWLPQVTWMPFTNGDIMNDSLLVINVKKGTYYVAIRDYCSLLHPELIKVEKFVIDGADPVQLVSFVKGNVTCNIWNDTQQAGVPSNDGYFTVTEVKGGFGSEISDYTYTLAGPKTGTNSTGTFTALPSGNYTLTIKDKIQGCQLVYNFAITKPDPLRLQLKTVNASCYGAQDGIIRYIITGGTGPYMESTNNGLNWFPIGTAPVQDTVKFDRQAGAGTYGVLIKDKNNCQFGAVVVEIKQPAALEILDQEVTAISCAGQTGLTATQDGVIRFKLKGGWNTAADGFVYRVTAKQGSTTKTATFVNSDITGGWVYLTGLAAGNWDVSVDEWNSSLYAGPYTTNPNYATVYANSFPSVFQNHRANECILIKTINVPAPAPVTYSLVFNEVVCRNTATGSIVLSNIQGGKKPYYVKLEGPVGSAYAGAQSYSSLGTANSKTWSNLPHGHYNVFIAYSNNGVTVSGGVPTYGTATMGCTLPYESGEVNNVDTLTLQMLLVDNAKCYNGLGKIQAVASGGKGRFKYAVVEHTFDFQNLNLADLPWQSSPYFDVPAGTWVGFVRDSVSVGQFCYQGWPTNSIGQVIQKHRVTVLQPTVVVGTATSGTTMATGMVDCFGNATGKIQVLTLGGGSGTGWSAVVSGNDYTGTPIVPKSYSNVTTSGANSWLGGLKASTNKRPNQTVPDSEKYTVVFYDSHGCPSAPVKVAVYQPEEFIIQLYVTQDAFICPTDLAGVFEIRIIQGGVAPVQYRWEAWSGNTKVVDTNWGHINTWQGPADLLYKVWAKDANGCVAYDEEFIKAPESIDFDVKDLSCFGEDKASARVSITGEPGRKFVVGYQKITTPASAWVWLTGVNDSITTSKDLIKMFTYGDQTEVEGHYWFQIRDSKGCTSALKKITFVPVQHPLQISANVVAAECTGQVTITVNGGTYPWALSLNGAPLTVIAGPTPNTHTFTGPAGTHTVAVVDNNLRCTESVTFTIAANPVARTAAITTYVGEKKAFVDAEAGIDTTLAGGVHTFNYNFNGCPRTLTVTVTEEVRYVTIKEIQGEVAVSPLVGKVRGIKGTVTGVVPGQGFFVQDASAAWSGIWVAYTGTLVQEGNGVDVQGTVQEVDNVTTLVSSAVTVIAPPYAITAVKVASPEAAESEMYESVLVVIEGARAQAKAADGTWVIFYQPTNNVTVNKWMFEYTPVAGNYYHVTGIVNGKGNTYKLEPRKLTDIQPITTSIDGIVAGNLQFKVYPNPFNDHLNIENHDKLVRVTVTNIAGQRVLDVQNPERMIRTANLVSGVYVVSLFTEDGIVKSERLIKR